ncbi:uncharacterized protein LOC141637287 [Silene latifolia]|uniref:uncharacterized protein LOC141637287 n=1 Tax=Silene latifolia TaxID=37657 RepID=UPI003D78530F
MKPGSRMNCTSDFDKFVSAEIPSVTNISLRTAVLKHMMYGPCGHLDPERQCMQHKSSKGRCKYVYPKQFADSTTNSSDGYPVYRRRKTGDSAKIRGHDKISFNIAAGDAVQVVDEIQSRYRRRWVSSIEAMWWIYGFDLFEIHPPVMPLPIHLPSMQAIQLRPHENLTRVVSNEKRIRTPLTEFFKINNDNEHKTTERYLYSQFTEHYRWDKTERTWFKRRNKLLVIARLVFVSPSEGERYFLRLLLNHVKSPKSFEDLKTVNGHCCSTYQEAALELRLIEEDNMPKDPVNPWDKYYTALSEDFRRELPNDAYTVRVLTVQKFEQHLEAMGKSLRTFGLAHLSETQDIVLRRTRDIIDALNAPIPKECVKYRSSLNPEQQQVFDTIVEHVRENKPGAFFVDGPGGTGKTYLYNALYAEVRLLGKIVLPTATSGIAAANIPSGRTTHSRFKIALDLDVPLTCAVPKQGSLAALIQATSLIIWDEASMARKETVEAVDHLLRDLCDPDLVFGGKLIVFGGDFRQVLPVVPHRSLREVVNSSMVSSAIWSQLIKYRLTVNVRAKDDPEFSRFLLALGNGELQTEETAQIELPPGIVVETRSTEEELITTVADIAYPESDVNALGTDIFIKRSIMAPMNEDVGAINTLLINRFPGEAVTYRGYDSMLTDNCNIYPAEFINTLCPGASGHYSGDHVFIPRIKMQPSASDNFPFQFQRNQFPLKLSFAMTINKSQGQTLDQVAIYLPRPCFSHGQLYVGLSRARTSDKVTVVSASTDHASSQQSVKNIVSYDVLRLAGII